MHEELQFNNTKVLELKPCCAKLSNMLSKSYFHLKIAEFEVL